MKGLNRISVSQMVCGVGTPLTLNPRIEAVDFDSLISAKSDQLVFVTLLNTTVTVQVLNRGFNALLKEFDLKTGTDGRTRTLYC